MVTLFLFVTNTQNALFIERISRTFGDTVIVDLFGFVIEVGEMMKVMNCFLYLGVAILHRDTLAPRYPPESA